MRFAHASCAPPTRLEPLARLLDADGKVINIARYALPPHTVPSSTVVVGVFGTTADAGTSLVTTSLAQGLAQTGHDVAVVRATGTSDFADHEDLEQADMVASDFTEVGMATTYLEPLDRLESAFHTLVGTAAEDGARLVIVEFAHGVLHRETKELLAKSSIGERLDGALFVAHDALAACGGVNLLREHGLAPLAVSGRITDSPLAAVEAEREVAVPVCSPGELRDGELAREVIAPALRSDALTLRVQLAASRTWTAAAA